MSLLEPLVINLYSLLGMRTNYFSFLLKIQFCLLMPVCEQIVIDIDREMDIFNFWGTLVHLGGVGACLWRV